MTPYIGGEINEWESVSGLRWSIISVSNFACFWIVSGMIYFPLRLQVSDLGILKAIVCIFCMYIHRLLDICSHRARAHRPYATSSPHVYVAIANIPITEFPDHEHYIKIHVQHSI